MNFARFCQKIGLKEAPVRRFFRLGIVFVILVLLGCIRVTDSQAAPILLLGNSNLESNQDYNSAGMAEAFQFTATASGSMNKLFLYVDSGSTATQIVIGIYSNSANNSPNALLGQATIVSPINGQWNTIAITPIAIKQGSSYWISVLGPKGKGILRFRDAACCGKAQTSSQTTLSTLPATWSAGTTHSNSPISAYGVGEISSGATNTLTSSPTATRTATPTFTRTATATATRTNTSTYTPTGTPIISNTPTVSSTPSRTASATATRSPTATSTSSRTATPTPTASPTATLPPGQVQMAFFAVGPGSVDVIPHQIVRAQNDRLYIFAGGGDLSTKIYSYWTINPGMPSSTSDFTAGPVIAETSTVISVETVYDGNGIIHVITNLGNGNLKDYPFDLATSTFKPAILIAPNTASGNPTSDASYTNIGTSGVSSMFASDGVLHLVYCSQGYHLIYAAYTYNQANNALTQIAGPTQVDTTQTNSNHPAVALSPFDGSLTVAWVSGINGAGNIFVRIRAANGSWNSPTQINTSNAWASTAGGLNIDQGPSILIDALGTRHIVYIENWTIASPYDYGRIHYVKGDSSGWTDRYVGYYTHDPALVIDAANRLSILGHGYPYNSGNTCKSVDEICQIRQNADGSWNPPELVAVPPANTSFDASPSVKWSVVGFNRPETIEFLFFSTPYDSPTLYYGRLASSGPVSTPTGVLTNTPVPTVSVPSTPTPTQTGLPTATLSATPVSNATPTPTATSVSTLPGVFPSNTALDNFNRADGGLGANWGGTISGYVVATNQLKVNSGQDIYWKTTSFGASQEVYVTVTSLQSSAVEIDLLLKSQSSSTWGNGVIEVWYDPLGQKVQVWTYDGASGWIQRGADLPVVFVTGDQFGAKATANGQVTIYRNGVLLGTRDVSGWAYSANGGYIGLWCVNANTMLFDNFGGGNVVSGP
jgi:hypothetical protein